MFSVLSRAIMASDTTVTEFTQENAEQTGLSGVEKRKRTFHYYRKRTKKTYRKNKSHETPTRAGKTFVLRFRVKV